MSLFSKTPIQQAEAILRSNNCDYSILEEEENKIFVHLDDISFIDNPELAIIWFFDEGSTYHITIVDDTEEEVLSIPPDRLDDLLYFANLCNSRYLRTNFCCMHVSNEIIAISLAAHYRDVDELYQGMLLTALLFDVFTPAILKVLNGAPRSSYEPMLIECIEIAANEVNRIFNG